MWPLNIFFCMNTVNYTAAAKWLYRRLRGLYPWVKWVRLDEEDAVAECRLAILEASDWNEAFRIANNRLKYFFRVDNEASVSPDFFLIDNRDWSVGEYIETQEKRAVVELLRAYVAGSTLKEAAKRAGVHIPKDRANAVKKVLQRIAPKQRGYELVRVEVSGRGVAQLMADGLPRASAYRAVKMGWYMKRIHKLNKS